MSGYRPVSNFLVDNHIPRKPVRSLSNNDEEVYMLSDQRANHGANRKQRKLHANVSDFHPSRETGHYKLQPDHSLSDKVTRYWLAEFAGCSIGLLCIGGISGTLIAFNGKPQPEWPSGITLGALVSVLATIATMGLMIPLDAAIGQAKWLWYRQNRPMEDFDLIESGSRSVVGALWVIIRWRGGFIAVFGAFLAIIAMGINPFVQQVIQYEARLTNFSSASIPIAHGYNTVATGTLDIGLGMKAAVQEGILEPDAAKSHFDVSPQCSTGNCTWPTFTTLAVCSQCIDLTSSLITTNSSSTLESTVGLPNGMGVTYIPATTEMNLISMSINSSYFNWSSRFPESLRSAGVITVFSDITIIVAPYGEDGVSSWSPAHDAYAAECILYFCTQKLSAKSERGVFNESLVLEPNNPQVLGNSNLTHEPHLEVGGTNYTVAYENANGISIWLPNAFQAKVSQSDSLGPTVLWPTDISQSIFYHMNQTSNHVPNALFANLAQSMTRSIRSISNEYANGTAATEQIFVRVSWPWMILPFSLLALVLVYLVVVIILNNRAGLLPWKTSTLAILCHGLMDGDSYKIVRGANQLAEMGTLAKRVDMRLVSPEMANGDGVWRLKLT